jgi:diguanylate cyclase (GGDEF)-like protein/PAS domain S-box-containing protein
MDKTRKIIYWNKAAEKISGYSAKKVVGSFCHDNILKHIDENGNNLCFSNCPVAHSLSKQTFSEMNAYLHHKDGHRISVSIKTVVLKSDNEETIGIMEIFQDISLQKFNELRIKELEKIAMLDNLTQLANRNYIEQEFRKCFEEKKRMGVNFGILFLDIDHFKDFNDNYGHDIGDKILKIVSNNFISNSRAFDLYGRWGGDEFIAIIKGINEKYLENLGNRIRTLIEHSSLQYKGDLIHVSVSIGATIAKNGDTMNEMIKRADKLLYKSKEKGRNCLTIG